MLQATFGKGGYADRFISYRQHLGYLGRRSIVHRHDTKGKIVVIGDPGVIVSRIQFAAGFDIKVFGRLSQLAGIGGISYSLAPSCFSKWTISAILRFMVSSRLFQRQQDYCETPQNLPHEPVKKKYCFCQRGHRNKLAGENNRPYG